MFAGLALWCFKLDALATYPLHTRNSRPAILNSWFASSRVSLTSSLSLFSTLGGCAIYIIRPSIHAQLKTQQHNSSYLFHYTQQRSGCCGCLIHILSVSPMPRFNGSLARASTGRATLRFRLRLISRCTHVGSVWAQIEFLSRSFPYCFCRTLTRHSW